MTNLTVKINGKNDKNSPVYCRVGKVIKKLDVKPTGKSAGTAVYGDGEFTIGPFFAYKEIK